MKTPLLILLLALSATFSTVRADPSIDAVLAPLAAPRAEADAKKAQLTSTYLADLEKLEPTIAEKTGNLEAVLRLRKEIEEWKAGRPTPAFVPGDPAVVPLLRARREAFDRERAAASAAWFAALREHAPPIIASLDKLILTKDGVTIKQRKAARTALAALTAELATATAPAPAAVAAPPPSPPPAKAPALNPLLGGALHAFGRTRSGKPVDLSAADGTSDFVSVSVEISGEWAAVRAGGEVVTNLRPLQDERLKNVARCEFLPRRILILQRDGRVATFGAADREAPGNLRSVVDASIAEDIAFAVQADGSLEAWHCNRAEPSTDLAREIRGLSSDLVDVLAIDSAGQKTAFVFRDGSLRLRLAHGRLTEPVPGLSPVADVAAGGTNFLALTREGKLHQGAYGTPKNIPLPGKLRGKTFTAIKANDTLFAARHPDGSWTAWDDVLESSDVVDKINSLGSIIDFDAARVPGPKQTSSGFVIWIH